MAVDKRKAIKPLCDFIRSGSYELFGPCDDWFLDATIGRRILRSPVYGLSYEAVLQHCRKGPDKVNTYDPLWIDSLKATYWGRELASVNISRRIYNIATEIITAERRQLIQQINNEMAPFVVSAKNNDTLEIRFTVDSFQGQRLTKIGLGTAVLYASLKKSKAQGLAGMQKGAVNLLYCLICKMKLVNQTLEACNHEDRILKSIYKVLLSGELDLIRVPDNDRAERARCERTLEELRTEFVEQGPRKIEMVESHDAVYTPRRRRIEIPKAGF